MYAWFLRMGSYTCVKVKVTVLGADGDVCIDALWVSEWVSECVCVCVAEREGERKRVGGNGGGGERMSGAEGEYG